LLGLLREDGVAAQVLMNLEHFNSASSATPFCPVN